jgi:hypothetical protein
MARYAASEPYFFRLVMVDLNEFGGEHLRRYGEPYDRPIGELVSAAPGAEGMLGAVDGLRQDIGGCDFTRFFLWLFYAMGFTATMRKAMTEPEQEDDTFRTLLAVVTRGVSADGGNGMDRAERRTT